MIKTQKRPPMIEKARSWWSPNENNTRPQHPLFPSSPTSPLFSKRHDASFIELKELENEIFSYEKEVRGCLLTLLSFQPGLKIESTTYVSNQVFEKIKSVYIRYAVRQEPDLKKFDDDAFFSSSTEVMFVKLIDAIPRLKRVMEKELKYDEQLQNQVGKKGQKQIQRQQKAALFGQPGMSLNDEDL